MKLDNNGALVLFSGGQDSTTCLAWSLNKFKRVETIGFDYRQRHVVELKCRENIRRELALEFPDWIERLGDDHTIDLGVLGKSARRRSRVTSKSRCSKTGFRAPSFPAATFSS